MERQRTINIILKSAGITNPQVDLVGKVLDLWDNPNEVDSIKLNFKTAYYSGIRIEVFLLKDIENIRLFRQYLRERELPLEVVSSRNETYILKNEDIIVEFKKADSLFSRRY